MCIVTSNVNSVQKFCSQGNVYIIIDNAYGQVGCLEGTYEFECPESERKGKNTGGPLDTVAAMKNENNVSVITSN